MLCYYEAVYIYGLYNNTRIYVDLPICCFRLSSSTWQQLELISGGSLTDTIKLISATQGETLTTEEHFKAVERRLLKIYATVHYCIRKHDMAKVIKNTF